MHGKIEETPIFDEKVKNTPPIIVVYIFYNSLYHFFLFFSIYGLVIFFCHTIVSLLTISCIVLKIDSVIDSAMLLGHRVTD